ncbi:MBL fold metallo-hydrolase [Lacibacter sp.]|uniref:MBL fold metallo-hydrolase n=1 Tax=Lacibacter sp. TaxID=1915409 RepID=UPI002B4B6A85|nr:MBL fold metallo-hydrolase [Lacibacter sp.]HLP37730.1 MBL fold metallo-hydrolase [Lacibacter sp.]
MNAPLYGEAEITLIGTGGYGESILLFLNNEDWIIIDSCVEPGNNYPASLQYLKSIGANLDKVVLVICTHWHNDHIRGISQVIKECINAQFCFSRAHDREKFLYFVSSDYQKSNYDRLNSSSLEFVDSLTELAKRSGRAITALENKILYNQGNCHVYALSPSEFTMEAFDNELAQLIPGINPNIKAIRQTPNARSVAIYVKIGEHAALLGADLEVSSNNKEGWLNILDNSLVVGNGKKASLFKISHHGSGNGYHERIFQELLHPNPVSKLTPWNKADGLPDPQMLGVYLTHTDQLYMTAPYISKSPKKRDKSIEKLIKSMNYELSEIKYKKGIISCRIKIDDIGDTWRIILRENSLKVEHD